jgi:hypothetical protein
MATTEVKRAMDWPFRRSERPEVQKKDDARFYWGMERISARADPTRVYVMIFRRLRSVGADWVCDAGGIGLVDFDSWREAPAPVIRYRPTAAVAADSKEREREAELEHCAELADSNTGAPEETRDRPPPATVRAYRQVYGRDPRGWPRR